MAFVSLDGAAVRQGFTRPIVQTLFFSTCLLSLVSWYTTQQGMALYLSSWFAVIASLGIQLALVMVAWLIGMERKRSVLLIAVYAITALVSIAFSYVSLYNWFSAKERPAEIQRALYDRLNAAAAQTDGLLAEASGKARRYVVALDEMTAAERSHGHVSKSGDEDPYLDQIRQSVAREAASVGSAYKEGSGKGVRYTAFDRHTKLTQQTLKEIETARRGLADWRSSAKPLEPAEQQLRRFHAAYDTAPWAAVEQMLGRKLADRPAVPNYADYVDKSASSQEDLLRAFSELTTAPGGRNVFALLLATFIDVIVFLLAFASGPYFNGSAEERWRRGAASLDAVDDQVFLRGLLSKLQASPMGLSSAPVEDLTPGERQFMLALEASGMAVVEERDGRLHYHIDREIQQRILESLAEPGIAMRASARKAAATGA